MKRVQPFVVLNALVLALTLICAVAVLGLPDSLVLAADRPAREQAKNADKSKQPESKEQGSSKNSGSDRGAKPPDRGSQEGAGKAGQPPSGASSGVSSSQPPRVVTPTAVQPLATIGSPARVALNSISIDDRCGISGTVSFSGRYWGELTLALTYHATGSQEFVPSGVTWSRVFAGEAESDFSLPMPIPEPDVEPDRRVNAFRIEVAAASSQLTNPTAKSGGFQCAEPAAESTSVPGATRAPTSLSSPVLTPASTAVPTVQVPSTTPAATITPDETETPVPEVTPTQDATLPPSPSAVSSATPTTTGTPTPFAIWTTRIAPDRSGNADPGTEAVYTHTVTNNGSLPDIKEVRVESSLGWKTEVLRTAGDSPLSDTDHNGVPDTGVLRPGESLEISVKVRVPEGAKRDTEDVAIVTASSSADPRGDGSASVVDTTRVNGVITVSLSTKSVSFGDVSPMGTIAGGSRDMTSSADEQGAYYTKSPAIKVTVDSNAPWNSSLTAQENDGTSRTIRIADGDLLWRLAGSSGWTTFDASPTSVGDGAAGTSDLVYDYRLRVDWDDDPGSFSSVVTYNATQ